MRAVVAATLPHWALLDEEDRERLATAAADLLERPSWEAAAGFALDDEIRGTIAGHAALLAVGLPDDAYHGVRTVVVHASSSTMWTPRPGPLPGSVDAHPPRLLGHTSSAGPVFIAWDVARRQARDPARGHNVVFHEFAHKLDAADGTVDGTPRLSGPERQRWIAVCQVEFDAIRAGGGSPLLSDYAATNPGEFFSVATEVFFDRSRALRADRPDLYAVLAGFYGQDPAGRAVGAG